MKFKQIISHEKQLYALDATGTLILLKTTTKDGRYVGERTEHGYNGAYTIGGYFEQIFDGYQPVKLKIKPYEK